MMKRTPSPALFRLALAVLSLAVALFVGLSGHAYAGDHDRAREALERGEILPLREILDRAQAHHPGEIIEVELERDDGRWIYELKLLGEQGLLLEMELDAATGALIALERDR